MSLPRQRPDRRPRRRGWLVPASLLALAPKCVLCLLPWLGAGTVLGLGGPEICGATGPDRTWTAMLAAPGMISGAGLLVAWGTRRWRRDAAHSVGKMASSSTSNVRPDRAGILPAWMLP